MAEYKRVFKVFSVGQEDRETAWLSKMSRDGYHLVSIKFATYYTFEKGEKVDYTYHIDYKENNNIDEEYNMMYSDAGLNYIDNSNGYYYFIGKTGAHTLDIIDNEQGRIL